MAHPSKKITALPFNAPEETGGPLPEEKKIFGLLLKLGHQRTDFSTDLFNQVVFVPLCQGIKYRAVDRVLKHPFPCKLTALDLLKYLTHRNLGLATDNTRATGEVPVLQQYY